jgi:hypothetical protein
MNIKNALLTAVLFAAVSTTSALAHVEEEVNDVCFGRTTTCGTDAPEVKQTVSSNDVETIITPVIIVTVTPAEETCKSANPGNLKCVGKAGEDPNGKGTMPNDSTDGNGKQGNKGR